MYVYTFLHYIYFFSYETFKYAFPTLYSLSLLKYLQSVSVMYSSTINLVWSFSAFIYAIINDFMLYQMLQNIILLRKSDLRIQNCFSKCFNKMSSKNGEKVFMAERHYCNTILSSLLRLYWKSYIPRPIFCQMAKVLYLV